jgi:hypothetical protein
MTWTDCCTAAGTAGRAAFDTRSASQTDSPGKLWLNRGQVAEEGNGTRGDRSEVRATYPVGPNRSGVKDSFERHGGHSKKRYAVTGVDKRLCVHHESFKHLVGPGAQPQNKVLIGGVVGLAVRADVFDRKRFPAGRS